MLKKYGDGIVASSACLGGVYAGDYWDNYEDGEEAVLDAMRETTKRMMECLGDRWFGELQWNNVPSQHTLNKYVIKMHEEFGINLISTADSHYPNAKAWKDRELYKRLGWLGSKKTPDYLKSELPIDIDEMGMELYPKNGDQMWSSYKKYSEECGVQYDDDLVYDSIVRTHWIAHEFIEEQINGYETVIGDYGNKLSGGQKQRLTIARAMLKSPSILILDEATSSLDSKSEKKIQDAINKLMQGKTSLIIAHKFSTIKKCDKIILIDKGRIIAQGTHEELINSNSSYKNMNELQI